MRARLFLALLLAATPLAQADDATARKGAEAAPHAVLDPHYGAVLFEFYQGHYFPALTALEVSQQFGRLSHHVDDAEILRGGMLLSYGLHEQAAAVFEQVLAHGAAPAVRNRAWYFLARIRYQRGLPAKAADALARIDGPLPAPLEEDRVLLLANVRMALGDYAGAAAALAPLAGNGQDNLYARYNLGVALVRSGDGDHGQALLDAIGRLSMPDEERRALRDRANVALGFAALKSGHPDQARVLLARVRLQGIESNLALLGFGWAADAAHDPKAALVPWQELSRRDPTDASVLEAQLAVPYAYAELGANAQALERYQVAIHNFEKEDANLDATISAIRAGKLVDGLMARNPGDRMGWFQSFPELPRLPHAGHLTPVLADNAFQEGFKNYRDLLYLQHNLDQWHDSLGVYDAMLATRRQGFAERLPRVRAADGTLGIERAAHQAAAEAADLATASATQDGTAFADAGERALQARLARVQATLAALPPDADPSLADAHERLRRVSAALAWRLAQAYPARDWEAKKALHQTELGLDVARGRDAALAQAQRDEPARFADFARRIADLQARVDHLSLDVARLADAQRQALDEIAVAALIDQKQRLAGYTAQARYAVARLYDHATEPTEAGHAQH